MLDVLLDVIVPILLIAAAGGIVGRRMGFAPDTLSKSVFNLFSPCLVFISIAEIELEPNDVGRVVAVAVVVFFANALVAWLWSSSRHSDRPSRASNVLGASVANQGNLGLPMAALAFGDAGLEVAVLTFVTGVALWSTAGIALGSLASGAHSMKRAATAPFRYPSIYAAAAGALVNVLNIDLPVAIEASTRTLGNAAIPTMLVLLGLQFRLPKLNDLADPLTTSANRLLIGPALAWPVAAALGLGGVAGDTAIMMAGMPAAVMTSILAAELGGDVALSVRTVIVSTLASTVTLTVLIAILR